MKTWTTCILSAALLASAALGRGPEANAKLRVISVDLSYPYYGLPNNGCGKGAYFVRGRLVEGFDGKPAGTELVVRLVNGQGATTGQLVTIPGPARAGSGADGTLVYCANTLRAGTGDAPVVAAPIAQPAAAPAPEAAVSPKDSEFAVAAARYFLGESPLLRTQSDFKSFETRVVKLVSAHRPGDLRHALQHAACVQEEMTAGADENQAGFTCDPRTGSPWNLQDAAENVYLRGVYFDHVLASIGDPASQRSLVDQFARSLGYAAVRDRNEGAPTYQLRKKAMSAWPQRTLKYALSFAELHRGSPAVLAELRQAAAVAPKFRCVYQSYGMVRDHLGGGRYGEMQLDHSLYVGGEDVNGTVSCSVAGSAQSDPGLLRAVRQGMDDPKAVLGAQWGPQSSWVLNRNRTGYPISQSRVVKVYLREGT